MDTALLCAGLAVLLAITNVVLHFLGKNGKPVQFLCFSMMGLALCAAYRSIIGLERSLVLGADNWLAFTVVILLLNGITLSERK